MTIKTVDLMDDGMGPMQVEAVDHYEMPGYGVYACIWKDLSPDEQEAFLLIHYREINVWVISNGSVVTAGTEEN